MDSCTAVSDVVSISLKPPLSTAMNCGVQLQHLFVPSLLSIYPLPEGQSSLYLLQDSWTLGLVVSGLQSVGSTVNDELLINLILWLFSLLYSYPKMYILVFLPKAL